MKKLLTFCFVVMAAFTFADAQTTVQGSKLTDNWFIGVDGGIYSKVKNQVVMFVHLPVSK